MPRNFPARSLRAPGIYILAFWLCGCAGPRHAAPPGPPPEPPAPFELRVTIYLSEEMQRALRPSDQPLYSDLGKAFIPFHLDQNQQLTGYRAHFLLPPYPGRGPFDFVCSSPSYYGSIAVVSFEEMLELKKAVEHALMHYVFPAPDAPFPVENGYDIRISLTRHDTTRSIRILGLDPDERMDASVEYLMRLLRRHLPENYTPLMERLSVPLPETPAAPIPVIAQVCELHGTVMRKGQFPPHPQFMMPEVFEARENLFPNAPAHTPPFMERRWNTSYPTIYCSTCAANARKWFETNPFTP